MSQGAGLPAVGERVTAPPCTVSDDLLATMTRLGGYTHPLFTDPAYVRERSPFDRAPLPGALVLFLLGGMTERTGRFDDVIALLGFEDVRFPGPALAGDTLGLEIEVLALQPTPSGRTATLVLGWSCTTDRGAEAVRARATFLVPAAPAAPAAPDAAPQGQSRQTGSRPAR